MSAQKALNAYRAALRATKIAFNGDPAVMYAARSQIKAGFYEKDDTKTDLERIEHLESVTYVLTSNVVQGKKKEDGNYFLNIHEKTELGDNESIKQEKVNLGSLAGVGCGGPKKQTT